MRILRFHINAQSVDTAEELMPCAEGFKPRDRVLLIDLDGECWKARVKRIADRQAGSAMLHNNIGISAVPREKWNAKVNWFASRRETSDRGVGDTVDRFVKSKGGGFIAEAFPSVADAIGAELMKALDAPDVPDSMAALYREIEGSDCKCPARRARLNALYPYQSDN